MRLLSGACTGAEVIPHWLPKRSNLWLDLQLGSTSHMSSPCAVSMWVFCLLPVPNNLWFLFLGFSCCRVWTGSEMTNFLNLVTSIYSEDNPSPLLKVYWLCSLLEGFHFLLIWRCQSPPHTQRCAPQCRVVWLLMTVLAVQVMLCMLPCSNSN